MLEDLDLLKRATAGEVTEADIASLYKTYHPHGDEGASPFRIDIATRAAQFGYFKWPVEIRNYIQGRRILDVGCGKGTDSLGFITLGAREYVGIDKGLKLDSDVVKNKRGSSLSGGMLPKETFGWTPNEINAAIPQISFFRGTFEELKAKENFKPFDLILMYTVTEHLIQIDEVFAGCAELLAKRGKFIYYHHNFYSWNGHHMAPKTPKHIDPDDPEQQKYVDWNHVLFDPPEGHLFHWGLNRIRLDELMAVTEKHFTIKEWREKRDDFGRMTEEIRHRLSAFPERELTTAKVFCVATQR